MLFALIHPPLTALPSGGNIYNDQIIQQAKLHDFNLHSIALADIVDKEQIITLNKIYGLLIWDSLFLQDLAKSASELKASQSCLLCHYLPSLNPVISYKQRCRWQSLENSVLDAMRFIIVTGQLIKNEIHLRFPNKRVELCGPGMDSVFVQKSENLNAVASTTKLLTVANLLPEKGYVEILQSLADINNHSWVWHICGSDSVNLGFTNQFWQTAKKLGLNQHINYRGILSHSQIASLMGNSELFVTASYYESFGMALAEAAAMRLPIISTQVGAANEIVKHGINGFVLPVGDQPGLQDYLQRLIDNASMRRKFSSRQHYRHQTWNECFKTFISICNHAIAES